jgi:hypothetical protein
VKLSLARVIGRDPVAAYVWVLLNIRARYFGIYPTLLTPPFLEDLAIYMFDRWSRGQAWNLHEGASVGIHYIALRLKERGAPPNYVSGMDLLLHDHGILTLPPKPPEEPIVFWERPELVELGKYMDELLGKPPRR